MSLDRVFHPSPVMPRESGASINHGESSGSPALAGDDDSGRKNTLGSEADLIRANGRSNHIFTPCSA
jgi:hypothetical protein